MNYSNLKLFDYTCRLLSPSIRQISTTQRPHQSAASKNHYTVLQLSPKCTQADVKSAYYKLSMVYHPDRNKDSQAAANQFRDIKAAYEVLGNVHARKMYDRGMAVHPAAGGGGAADAGGGSRFERSREARSRPPAPAGRTVYDFDEWSKAHYGATFARDQRIKRNRVNWTLKNEEIAQSRKVEGLIAFFGIMFVIGTFMFSKKDFDFVAQRSSIKD